MEKKVLFGNNISNDGKNIAKNFKYFNFKVSYCGNNHSSIMHNLRKKTFDAVFFLIMKDDEEIYSFIENIKKEFPAIMIYPVMCGKSEITKDKLIKCGAENCFEMPITSEELCFSVIYDFFCDDEIMISIDIASFLIKNNFPIHVKGFCFLSLCIEMIIDEPELFENFSKRLYPAIEQKTGSSTAWIERSLRNLSKSVYKDGMRFDNYPDEKNLTNKNFVRAITNMYCVESRIRRR